MNKIKTFEDYVKDGILTNNEFDITEVTNLESLKSIYFINDEYIAIEQLIRTRNIEAIKASLGNQSNTGEYLEILKFEDQNKKGYIVTVYDSNALEQDPQVIKVYSF